MASSDVDAQGVIERALENSPIASALAASDGHLTWTNAAMCSLLDRSAEEITSGTWRELTHPEDVSTDDRLVEEIVAGKRESYRLRKRFQRPNGDEIPASITVTCLRDETGAVQTLLKQVVSLEQELAMHRELLRGWDRLGAAVESGIDPMVICDAVRDDQGGLIDLRIAAASRAVEAFAKRPRSALIGGPLELVFPGYRDSGWWPILTHVVEGGSPAHAALVDASTLFSTVPRWLEYQVARVDDGLAVTWRDVTAAYEATQEEVRKANEQYRLMIENSGDVVFHTVQGIVKWVSPSCKEILGWGAEELVGHRTAQFWHPDDLKAAVRLRNAAYAGRPGLATLRWRRSDGSFVWVDAVIRPVTEASGESGAVGSLRDVNERVSIQRELDRVLGHDPLTGLGNLASLLEELSHLSGMADGVKAWPALICIGVDRLSIINDALGHGAGDHVLSVVATRLVEELGDPRRIWRGAGVDFYVVAPPQPDIAAVGLLADRLRLAVKGPIEVDHSEVDVTVSVGVAFDRQGRDPEDLVQAASLATGNAKASGRDRVCFEDPALTTTAQRHIETLALAKTGLESGSFKAFFMPIASLRTGRIVGFEALARWQESGGVLEPAEFVPILESTALICDLDQQILVQGLDAARQLPPGMFMSSNLSARTLADSGCVHAMVDAVGALIGPERPVHLEITETSLLPAAGEISAGMCRLSDLGVHWYVDDFGIGFSSISHIRDLPISGLKLDKSFTAGIGRGDETSLRLAQALAGLAQGLELDTVAEGVDTAGESAALRAQGWRHGQGWHFGRAMPAEELGGFLERFSSLGPSPLGE